MAVYGGSHIIEVLLPRVSTLGLMGLLFNSVRLAPAGGRAIFVLFFYILAVAVSITLIVDTSLQGNDFELLYFLIPSMGALTALCLIIGLVIAQDHDPVWLANLGLEIQGESGWQTFCSRVVPPYWQQVVQVLDGQHNAKYAQMANHVMELNTLEQPDPAVHPEDAGVLRLDPPSQEEVDAMEPHLVFPAKCTYFVDRHSATEAASKNSFNITAALACIRRIPNVPFAKDKESSEGPMGILIDVLDIVG